MGKTVEKKGRKKLSDVGQPDRLAEAYFVRPSSAFLRFADGKTGTWTFSALKLDASNLKPATIKAAASGTAMEAVTRRGDTVQMDSSWLRAVIDPRYAAKLEKALLALRGPIDDL